SPFAGSIDEFKVWLEARSQNQIRSEMTSVVTAPQTNLLLYYNFDHGTAGSNNAGVATLVDAASSYNGTLVNSALSGTTSNWVESYAMVVPTATSATNRSYSSFTANWTAPTVGTVTNYLLDVSTVSTFTSFVSGYNGLSVNGTSYNVTGLTANTTYYYRVRADKSSVTTQGAYSATITASTTTVPLANALQFDGSGDYVTIPYNASHDLSAGGALTIEAWIRPAGGGNVITKQNYGYGLGVESDGRMFFWDQSSQASSVYAPAGIVTMNRWQHVAVTVEDIGSTLRVYFYVNGTQYGPYSSSQAQINNGAVNGTLDIGVQARGTCTCNYFNGTMDELRVWNTVRTAAQIRSNMYQTISGTTANLVAYYNFDNGTAGGTNTGVTTLSDQTANANNGTLTGF
ncbi:MAG TPA: hypothetical protein DCL43_12000, partial [Chitinophagaceae bacterium]|nr:hypothetical protein [Chitinophagaceae bacterium]